MLFPMTAVLVVLLVLITTAAVGFTVYKKKKCERAAVLGLVISAVQPSLVMVIAKLT